MTLLVAGVVEFDGSENVQVAVGAEYEVEVFLAGLVVERVNEVAQADLGGNVDVGRQDFAQELEEVGFGVGEQRFATSVVLAGMLAFGSARFFIIVVIEGVEPGFEDGGEGCHWAKGFMSG